MKTTNESKLRALYSAALFWDAITAAAMAECLDGELPEEVWDEAEDQAIAAKTALANEIKGLPRFNETRATVLVFHPNKFYELEEYILGLEGIANTGFWAEITGRAAYAD